MAGALLIVSLLGAASAGPPRDPDAERARLAGALEGHVRVLAGRIGERNAWNSRQLEAAAAYIEENFAEAGLTTEWRGYEVAGEEFGKGSVEYFNLVAEKRGTEKAGEVIVVGAHYDSVHGSPGADDNASAVAAMLELAMTFGRAPTARTIRFVAFVNEEPPFYMTRFMGSRVYARECRERGDRIVAMLSLEMLGCYSDERGSQTYPPLLAWLYPDTANFIAVVGNVSSRALVKEVAGSFREAGGIPVESIATFELVPGVGFSDHASFWKHGYRAAMITDTAFYRSPYYHSPLDTPEKLDYGRMAEVTRGISGWLARAAE